MNQVSKLKQLENLSFFNRATLSQVVSINKKNLYENINRWLKQGRLIQLKKGLYVSEKYYDRVINKQAYTEFIANKLRYPSYLSLEYVLQKYNVLTEAIYSYTSVSLKRKKDYKNKLGKFIYRNINKKLFTGFKLINLGEFKIKEADLSKALFDYLYLKLYRVKQIDQKVINDLRLNLDEFGKQDKLEFKKYCSLPGIKKFKDLPKLIFK